MNRELLRRALFGSQDHDVDDQTHGSRSCLTLRIACGRDPCAIEGLYSRVDARVTLRGVVIPTRTDCSDSTYQNERASTASRNATATPSHKH